MTRTPTWKDGTPKSIHNAFSAFKDGTASIFAGESAKRGPKPTTDFKKFAVYSKAQPKEAN